jgi:hypothetical protein
VLGAWGSEVKGWEGGWGEREGRERDDTPKRAAMEGREGRMSTEKRRGGGNLHYFRNQFFVVDGLLRSCHQSQINPTPSSQLNLNLWRTLVPRYHSDLS